eukprot:TRINITY_DN739_c1_g3_i1.p1 TRINITY_DN739_c1_g3~~TRINITY_DN739_c1_g3_i1.p1  ORF type:complete len:190 (-),score=31.70 TRINITY_DN739_c1_g3_i1:156-725(-)
MSLLYPYRFGRLFSTCLAFSTFAAFIGVNAIPAGPVETGHPTHPLLDAAGEGNIKMVKEYLEMGHDVNWKSVAGETPLHVSTIMCKKEIMKDLLTHKADVNAFTYKGQAMSMTPLHWAVNMNRCDEQAISMLVNANANLFAQNEDGDTPLDMAKRMPHRKSIVDLLKSAIEEERGGGKKEDENEDRDEM